MRGIILKRFRLKRRAHNFYSQNKVNTNEESKKKPESFCVNASTC